MIEYTPSLDEFLKRADHGNLVPVYREILADLETPVSAFLKLREASGGYAFLLESVAGGENIARYSYLACNPHRLFSSKGNTVTIRADDGSVQEETLPEGKDPLHALKAILDEYKFVPLPGWERFPGGAVGYMGYDLVRFFEDLPEENPDDLNLPDCQFMIADTIVIFDHVMHRARILANAHVGDGGLTPRPPLPAGEGEMAASLPGGERGSNDPQSAYWDAIARIDAVVETLRKPLPPQMPTSRTRGVPPDPSAMPSTMTRAQHKAAVEKAKEYISAGDIIQVVLSHRMSAQVEGDPFDLYRSLRAINPSPYMFYLSFDDLKIIGASPEILVTEDAGHVVTRPIAGTRRRGKTPAEDEALEQDLLSDIKERAEHIMLVDLHRNDIGRVCKPGTVKVDELMVVERYSHVMHIVSNVVGELAEGKDQFDLLRATFPAGTLSGAPKIRAMEIIEELEPVRRGPYGGAVGYFGFSGSMDTCITLRTIVMKGNTCYFQAGGGIVADSDPAAEYRETLLKAGALLDAARMAEEGLV